MSDASKKARGLKLVGGATCLDFANTSGWRPDPGDEEYLRDYEDLLAWSEHAGALADREARALRRAAKASPERAKLAHRHAIALREAVYRVFSTAAAGRSADAADIDLLNRMVDEAGRHLRLAPTGVGFAWEWHGTEGALDLPLWRLARSAADLLITPELARVRECSGLHCDWLFLDASKNRSRRWCDMANCGNRAKARRNYARRRASGAAEPGT
ncbi:MAG: ABATE domain-containing protein [Candidatus Bipolaricaulis sp.]|nr:ABATE domain-containing protein [Candidatus Bipolaricaulis sp.]